MATLITRSGLTDKVSVEEIFEGQKSKRLSLVSKKQIIQPGPAGALRKEAQ